MMNDASQLRLFKDSKAAKRDSIGAAFDVELTYDAQHTEFRSLPVYKADVIPRSLLEFFSNIIDDPQDWTTNWTNVLDYIDKAQVMYSGKAPKDSFKDLVRRGQGLARALESLTDLIPDENGLSVLRASLSFVFRAWARRLRNMERLFEELGMIPYQLSRAYELWECYTNDAHLTNLVNDYHHESLKSLKELFVVLLRKDGTRKAERQEIRTKAAQIIHQSKTAIRHITREVVQQLTDEETSTINQVVANLERLRAKLDDRVAQLGRLQNTAIYRDTRASLKEIQTTRQTANKTEYGVSCVQALLERRCNKVEDMIGMVNQQAISDQNLARIGKVVRETFYEEIAKYRQNTINLVQASQAETIQKCFYRLSSENRYKAHSERANTFFGQSFQDGPQQQLSCHGVSFSTDGAFAVVGVDPRLSARDEESIVRKSHQIDPNALSRASALMTIPSFQIWLTEPTSGVLVVDGDCGDTAIGTISALSVFCAALAVSLAQCRNFVILDYFCGQNVRSWGDNFREKALGPRGLVRSLINQMLLRCSDENLQLGFAEEVLYDKLSSGDPNILMVVFTEVLQKMNPGKTIFCIIDGVSDFETISPEWNSEMSYFIDSLIQLASSRSSTPALKLLIATSAQSRILLRHPEVPWASLMSREVSNTSLLERRPFDGEIHRMAVAPSRNGF